MKKALIGATGFVGGNLAKQTPFDDFYHSRNIQSIRGKEYELVVCAGAPAVKWKANQDPEGDWQNLRGLIEDLEQVKARDFILISTVDVYACPVGVDEACQQFASLASNAYGYNRHLFEQELQKRFPELTILRLPGLFGEGLKKNVIYDLLHQNCLEMIHPKGVFQFYHLKELWNDIGKMRRAGIHLMNLATEPLAVQEMAQDCFAVEFSKSHCNGPAPNYDFRSQYSSLWGRADGYLYDKAQIKESLRAFIQTGI